MKFLLSFLILICASHGVHAESAIDGSGPEVVLKLDDMQQRGGAVPAQWSRVYDYAMQQSLPISIGIICNSLEGDNSVYFDTLKTWHAGGLVEFWNHGYDHKQWQVDGKRVREFSASGYDHQYGHFKASQDLAVEKLGFMFTTFGAPFNGTDEDTKKVLAQFPEINAWLYGPSGAATGHTVLPRNYSVNLEVKVGTVDFDTFQAAYLAKPIGARLTLQGHPMGWNDSSFASFVRIIDFLKEQGATFLLPRDCVSQ